MIILSLSGCELFKLFLHKIKNDEINFVTKQKKTEYFIFFCTKVKLMFYPNRSEIVGNRRKTNVENQSGTKIIVRNIPFQATIAEIRQLFQ